MGEVKWKTITACRACGSEELRDLFNFGDMPLSDRLAKRPETEEIAPRVPLELVYCSRCHLSQLSVDVAPECLYDENYPYFSSVSPQLREHFRDLAEEQIAKFALGQDDHIIEAASNDGCLLQNFVATGARIHGFEPASGPANAAKKIGIPTHSTFFGLEAARSHVAREGYADLFLATNVLAHVPDLRGFVEAISVVLRPRGHAVIEVPYLVDLVENGEFDTIYHQHLCYFLITPLQELFEAFGLGIVQVSRQAIHGGSLRITLQKLADTSSAVHELVAREQASGKVSFEFAQQVGGCAERVKSDLRALICDLRARGGRIWAYGAAAKATTLLSWCEIGTDDLVAVADLNVHKHGKYLPGTDLRIEPVEVLMANEPDVVLILAWNFAAEIISQLQPLRRRGTRFMVPIPRVEMVA